MTPEEASELQYDDFITYINDHGKARYATGLTVDNHFIGGYFSYSVEESLRMKNDKEARKIIGIYKVEKYKTIWRDILQ